MGAKEAKIAVNDVAYSATDLEMLRQTAYKKASNAAVEYSNYKNFIMPLDLIRIGDEVGIVLNKTVFPFVTNSNVESNDLFVLRGGISSGSKTADAARVLFSPNVQLLEDILKSEAKITCYHLRRDLTSSSTALEIITKVINNYYTESFVMSTKNAWESFKGLFTKEKITYTTDFISDLYLKLGMIYNNVDDMIKTGDIQEGVAICRDSFVSGAGRQVKLTLSH